MNFSKQALVDAVGALVDLDNERAQRYGHAVESMARFRARHPDAWLGYELEPLNPLVALAESDADGFSRLQQLIDEKRRTRGAEPIWPNAAERGFDKPEYQRLLMQERRQRSRRALEIENMRRPERSRLIGNARLEFENRVIAAWGNQLRDHLDKARKEAGGRLPKERLTSIREAFWKRIDSQLDDEYEAARLAQLRVPA